MAELLPARRGGCEAAVRGTAYSRTAVAAVAAVAVAHREAIHRSGEMIEDAPSCAMHATASPILLCPPNLRSHGDGRMRGECDCAARGRVKSCKALRCVGWFVASTQL